MQTTLIETIARHYPKKDKAAQIIAAIETVIGHAQSQLEDLQSGVDQGLYEPGENRADIKELESALELLDA